MIFINFVAMFVVIELATMVAMIVCSGRSAERRFSLLFTTTTVWFAAAAVALLAWARSATATETHHLGWFFVIDAAVNATLAIVWLRAAAIESQMRERRK